MITQDQVLDIFIEHLPDVSISFIPREDFIYLALLSPFIQRQIGMGIYDNDNIYTDFLSPAFSYPALNRLNICYELLLESTIGTDLNVAIGYITNIAVHEAHHFEELTTPQTADDHASNELECINAVAIKHPHLAELTAKFEETSHMFQRVYKRMKRLGL